MTTAKQQQTDHGHEIAETTRGREPADPGSAPALGAAEKQALRRAIANRGMATPAAILALQRATGNRAVQRFVSQRRIPEGDDRDRLQPVSQEPLTEGEGRVVTPKQRTQPDRTAALSGVGSATSHRTQSPPAQGARGAVQRKLLDVPMGEANVAGQGAPGLTTDGLATCVGVAAYDQTSGNFGLVHVPASDYTPAQLGAEPGKEEEELKDRVGQAKAMVAKVGGKPQIWIHCPAYKQKPTHIYQGIVAAFGGATDLSPGNGGKNKMSIKPDRKKGPICWVS